MTSTAGPVPARPVPTVTAVRMSGAPDRAHRPLLVLGPALGTSAQALWAPCVAALGGAFDVLGWDLPGHGHNRAAPAAPGAASWDLADLAAGVLAVVDDVVAQRGGDGSFEVAGVGIGALTGLQLALDAPGRVQAVVHLGAGARLGSPALWAGRAGQVAVSGPAVLTARLAGEWSGPAGAPPGAAAPGEPLLRALRVVTADGLLGACGALADADLAARLGELTAPVLAAVGAHDPLTGPADVEALASAVRRGRAVVVPDAGHLVPHDAPAALARLLHEHVLGEPLPPPPGRPGDLTDRERALVLLAAGRDPDGPSDGSAGGSEGVLDPATREAVRALLEQ